MRLLVLDSDPEEAIEDALKTFPADRILVFSHGGEEQRYREDIDAEVLQSRFGIPVTQSRVSSSGPAGAPARGRWRGRSRASRC